MSIPGLPYRPITNEETTAIFNDIGKSGKWLGKV